MDSSGRPRRQPVTGLVLAQLREFFGVPRNWAWAAPPVAAGLAGAAVLAAYRGPGPPVPLLVAGGVCAALGLAIWVTYSTLATVPALLRGSRIAAMLRKDALTFLPLTAALALAAASLSIPLSREEGHVAGALTGLAVALILLSLAAKVYFLDADVLCLLRPLRGRGAVVCVVAAVLIGGGAIAVAAVWRHSNFLTYTHDLGIMDQTVWNTAHGRLLHYSLGREGLVSRPLTGRLEVPFLILAPLYWLWADPRVLQLCQALALALGAAPLYLLGKRWLGSSAAAAAVAVCFVLHPAVQGIGLAAVHTNAFAVPLVIGAFLALEQRRPRAFLVWCLAALCCREDLVLAILPLGVYAALRPSFRRAGLLASLLSVAWLVTFKAVLPRLSGLDGGEPAEREMLGLLSRGFGGMAAQLLHEPSLLLTQLLRGPNALYASRLLVPAALLPLLSPGLFLLALPAVYFNMITGWAEMNNIHSQYQAYVVSTLAVAGLAGAARLNRELTRWAENSRWARTHQVRPGNALAAVCLLCLACAVYGRVAFGRHLVVPVPWPRQHTEALQSAVSLIPAGASVTAPQHVGPHLSQRRDLRTDDPGRPLGEYVVCDAKEPLLWLGLSGTRDSLRVLPSYRESVLRRADYGIVFCEHHVIVLRQGAAHEEGLRRLYLQTVPADPPTSSTVDGWHLVSAETHVEGGERAWLVTLRLAWRPKPGAAPLSGALNLVSGGKTAASPYRPAMGLISAPAVGNNQAITEEMTVYVGSRLGPDLRVELETAAGTTEIALVPLPPASSHYPQVPRVAEWRSWQGMKEWVG